MAKESIVELAKKVGFCGYGEETGSFNIPTEAFFSRLERFYKAARNDALNDASSTCQNHPCLLREMEES